MAKFNLGDEVLLQEPSYGHNQPAGTRKTKVIKSGTKYVYVDGGSGLGAWRFEGMPFDKETGRMKTNPKRNSHYDPSIWVPAEWEAHERRATAMEGLRQAGVSFRWDRQSNLTIEQLEKMLAILTEED